MHEDGVGLQGLQALAGRGGGGMKLVQQPSPDQQVPSAASWRGGFCSPQATHLINMGSNPSSPHLPHPIFAADPLSVSQYISDMLIWRDTKLKDVYIPDQFS